MCAITDDGLLCDGAGNPIDFFHGTNAVFGEFSDYHPKSLGHHFGCQVQARHFATGPNGRIIRAWLRVRNPIDIGQGDFGWLNPNRTVCCLLASGEIEEREAKAFLKGGRISLAAHKDTPPVEECRRLNQQIVELLEAKGVDAIQYANRQEPGDGVWRKAILVLRSKQIHQQSVASRRA